MCLLNFPININFYVSIKIKPVESLVNEIYDGLNLKVEIKILIEENKILKRLRLRCKCDK